MLLRISLIFAILAGIGIIVVTHLKTREQIQGIITEREAHKKEEAKQLARANKGEKELATKVAELTTTKDTLAKTEEDLNGARLQLTAATENLNKVKGELSKAIEERKTAQAELAKWEGLGLKPEQIKDMVAKLKMDQDAIAARHDGHARGVRVLRGRDVQGVDVVAAAAEQSGHAREHAELVLDQDRDGMSHI